MPEVMYVSTLMGEEHRFEIDALGDLRIDGASPVYKTKELVEFLADNLSVDLYTADELDAAYEKGYDKGDADGYAQGHDEGYEEGHEMGKEG